MKKIIVTIFFCISALFASAQYGVQLENRGFESWENYGKNSRSTEPVHWHSTKSATGTFNSFLSQQIEASSHSRPGSTGGKSVRVWPVSVVGITANGNLTNGRMNAGSMTVTGKGNYNYTQRSDKRFCTPISVVPDSLVVWICFRCADPMQEAMVNAVVHGDADFKLIANGTVEPADKLVATAKTTFRRTSHAGGNLVWRRLSIPFVKDGPCNDPRYLLFTITTNAIPGQGSIADDLFVDDVMLIY